MKLDGRVAIVTGAGRGLGRAHAIELARHGAKVLINDVGAASDGTGIDDSVVRSLVDEIRSAGGHAVTNGSSVADWQGARNIVDTALDAFGRLDIVVNNAGILRDRMLVTMEEADWDAVLAVHLKGTMAVTKFAAEHWRHEAKAGRMPTAAVVNTSSSAGLFNNVGQANYGAAKAGIVALSMICAKELERYGVRVNVVAPGARTRLTTQTPGVSELQQAPEGGFDIWEPANVSSVVAYLVGPDCPLTGTVFHVVGGQVAVLRGWTLHKVFQRDSRWTADDLHDAMKPMTAAGAKLLSESDALDDMLARLGVAD